MRKFQVGDIVQVTNCGCYYPTYSGWAKKNNMQKWKEKGDYYLEDLIKKDPKKQFKVIAVDNHNIIGSDILYGIEYNNGQSIEQFIIGESGLKFYTSKSGKCKVSILKVNHNIYPHKCPDCQNPSWNNMFHANQIKCSNKKCKYYEKIMSK